MVKNRAMDLSTGKPIKQLYSFADAVMVGRLIDSNALAAGVSHHGPSSG